jgi:hypothetical protein
LLVNQKSLYRSFQGFISYFDPEDAASGELQLGYEFTFVQKCQKRSNPGN